MSDRVFPRSVVLEPGEELNAIWVPVSYKGLVVLPILGKYRRKYHRTLRRLAVEQHRRHAFERARATVAEMGRDIGRASWVSMDWLIRRTFSRESGMVPLLLDPDYLKRNRRANEYAQGFGKVIAEP